MFLQEVHAWEVISVRSLCTECSAFCDRNALAGFTYQPATVGRILRIVLANAWDCLRWRYGVLAGTVQSPHLNIFQLLAELDARLNLNAASSPFYSI